MSTRLTKQEARRLGARVRFFRGRFVSSPITMRQLAKAVGVSVAAIAHYESGRRAPTIAVLCRLAREFRCTPNDLLGWTTTGRKPDAVGLLYRHENNPERALAHGLDYL